jgi:itaconate CoA-transferase
MSAIPERYRSKVRTAAEAVAMIPDGAFVVQGDAVGEPPALLEAVAARARAGGFTKVTMTSLLPLGASARTIFQPDVRSVIEWRSIFASGADRGMIGAGEAVAAPALFHQVPRIYREFLKIDVALIHVSRVDEHGYMSLGVAVDVARAAIDSADVVLAQVNAHMPRVHGDSWVHVSEVDALVEHSEPLTVLPPPDVQPEDAAMGHIIAEMIPNGATIQLGIGGVPSAVARALVGHKDLGVHTEMFVDTFVDLIEAGVVTNRRKTLHPGKVVFAFAAGSPRMYEFLDDNPLFESHPVSYTNHPATIARNNAFISVNSTIEIDLTGQCCSESIGPMQWSGTGGQHDFARGAFESPGGKSIIAFYSTAKEGTISRVVPTLRPGAVVTTPRTEVHWVVSEHGGACLKGKSTAERAQALIGLAHPKFRDELRSEAKRLKYI